METCPLFPIFYVFSDSAKNFRQIDGLYRQQIAKGIDKHLKKKYNKQ